ncbi:MAG: hypothetical protein HFI95_07140 [Lachnospiraceae bacterium]|jgi:hypothetical protein|nr:hypothetical protein [Lachnospiraceae bacterium]
MFTILMEHEILTGLIFFSLLLGIICQIIPGVIYQRMISASDHMAETKNKQLKSCKEKYAGHYKLNGKMVNTGVFVDKFLQKVCIARIKLSFLNHISGQMMMLSILITGLSICLSLASGSTLFQIIPYYLVSILGMYLYFSISGMVNLQEKKEILRINLTDYLENYLAPRLETEKENAMEEGVKKREKYGKELLKELEAKEKAKEEETKNPQSRILGEILQPVMNQHQEELESLLEEFFA